MTKDEAEMLLKGQEEEESRMRAEDKKGKHPGEPVVLRDW